MKLKEGLALLRQFVPEVEPNETFMQQLAEYDLETLSNKFWWLIFHIFLKFIKFNEEDASLCITFNQTCICRSLPWNTSIFQLKEGREGHWQVNALNLTEFLLDFQKSMVLSLTKVSSYPFLPILLCLLSPWNTWITQYWYVLLRQTSHVLFAPWYLCRP